MGKMHALSVKSQIYSFVVDLNSVNQPFPNSYDNPLPRGALSLTQILAAQPNSAADQDAPIA
jgi:hypothetical protein